MIEMPNTKGGSHHEDRLIHNTPYCHALDDQRLGGADILTVSHLFDRCADGYHQTPI